MYRSTRLQRLMATERMDAFLDRHRYAALALWSLWFAASTAMRSSAKPFWHDEIYTVLLARLPTIADHWSALRDGVDFAPPLNGFATRAVRHLAGTGPLAARMPAMIGFWTMAMVVFAVVRQRASATLAFAAICLPLFTAAYRYSYEARPYGLMMGLAALAWFFWLRAAAGQGRRASLPLLSVALAAGLWTHYYAVLVYLPIAAGEATRLIRERRVDVPLWAAVAASVLGALPLAPLVHQSMTRTAHFWVKPSMGDIPATYAFLIGGLASFAWWQSAAVGAAILWGRFRAPSPASRATTIPAHEVAALIACVLIPVFGVLAALVATGGFVPRYGLPAVCGVAMGVALLTDRLARRAHVAAAVLLVVLLAAFGESTPPFARILPFENPVAARPELTASLAEPGSTVVVGELMFLQLWYYAPPASRARLAYLADPDQALRYRGSDIVDMNYLALARWTPVPVVPFDAFVRTHPEFRLYAAGSGWQLDRLRDMHAAIDLLGSEPGGRLFTVRPAP